MSVTDVVFDIGGVLVEWKPALAWSEDLGGAAEAEAFMARIDFAARNARADGGERFADLAAEIDDADDARRLADYVPRYARTVQDSVPGTWDVLQDLKDRGVPVHAITNWSAETWPEGLKAHPRLGEAFGALVVSGREGVMKPDPRIFALLCERAGVAPAACVFVDDSEKNVVGARRAGMDAIHFTGADALRAELARRGLL